MKYQYPGGNLQSYSEILFHAIWFLLDHDLSLVPRPPQTLSSSRGRPGMIICHGPEMVDSVSTECNPRNMWPVCWLHIALCIAVIVKLTHLSTIRLCNFWDGTRPSPDSCLHCEMKSGSGLGMRLLLPIVILAAVG